MGDRRNEVKLLWEIAVRFFKLGCVGFGGPQAHIAMMEDQFVRDAKWVTQEQFAEGVGLCSVLPGPTSSQVAIWLGYQRSGRIGALTSGLAFIIPAFVLLLTLSWAYFSFGSLPRMSGMFAGIRPAVIAIILAACQRMSKSAVKNRFGQIVMFAAMFATLLGVDAAVTLIIAGLIGWMVYVRPTVKRSGTTLPIWIPLWIKSILVSPLAVLAIFFLKVGALLFGGGLVIIPFLQHEVVDVRHWLTLKAFLDGVALGQMTPGPVVITATFIGYRVAHWWGAVVATAAIFTPSFLFILFAAPQLEKLRRTPAAKGFLLGVSPAVVGTILAVCVTMWHSIIQSTPVSQLWLPAVIFVLACYLQIVRKISAPVIVVGAALIGLIFFSSCLT